ncbi:MAG: mechanosensitive ion channel family protein [Clostridiaceae bacterium]|nr:mechanosensitive ion channel family protein [Clostridiaceae bacterium]
MPDFFEKVFFGNTVARYAVFLGVLLLSWIVIRVISKFVLKKLSMRKEQKESSALTIIYDSSRKYLVPLSYVVALYFSLQVLTLSAKTVINVRHGIVAVITIILAVFFSGVAVYVFRKYWEIKHPEPQSNMAARWISGAIKILIWAVAILLFLDNIGVRITALAAGLGVSGIAIAFAAQSILADIFCYFSIAIDRPFDIGDFIIVGAQSGNVEHIGIKTTRVRSLSGEELVFSNVDLTSSRIQNFKTMTRRRIVFRLAVTYDTSANTLKEIPDLIRDIFAEVAQAELARVHFVGFGVSSLDFEIVYFVPSGDFDVYLDLHQKISLLIKERFDQKEISFAFPTQTVRVVAAGVATTGIEEQAP